MVLSKGPVRDHATFMKGRAHHWGARNINSGKSHDWHSSNGSEVVHIIRQLSRTRESLHRSEAVLAFGKNLILHWGSVLADDVQSILISNQSAICRNRSNCWEHTHPSETHLPWIAVGESRIMVAPSIAAALFMAFLHPSASSPMLIPV